MWKIIWIISFFNVIFRILLKKSGTRIPNVELEEIGPRADLVYRRGKLASDDLFKQACKKPKALKVFLDRFFVYSEIHFAKRDLPIANRERLTFRYNMIVIVAKEEEEYYEKRIGYNVRSYTYGWTEYQ